MATEMVYEKRSVSFPSELLGLALEQAVKEHRSFSGYVAALVTSDLRRKGVIVDPMDDRSVIHARLDELLESHDLTPEQILVSLESSVRKVVCGG